MSWYYADYTEGEMFPVLREANGGEQVCLVWDKKDLPLIVAAPDLLAALEALASRVEAWHRGVAEGVELIGLAYAAREAITKAKGTTP